MNLRTCETKMNRGSIIKFITSFLFIFHSEYIHHCQSTPLIGNSVRLAEKNEFPFIVSIGSNMDKNSKSKIFHICGGSLITYSHVLTAAHCFEDDSKTQYVAKVGSIDLRNARIYQISWWVKYNEWVLEDDPTVKNGDRSHDIAIAKLSNNVNSSIQLAILTKQPESNIYGKETVTAGWGLIENEVLPKIMRAVDLTVHYPEQCDPITVFLGNDTFLNSQTPKFFCTFAIPPALMTCGDSGSPLLLHRREIIGVNIGRCTESLGPKIRNEINLHAAINYYRKFILDVIRPQ